VTGRFEADAAGASAELLAEELKDRAIETVARAVRTLGKAILMGSLGNAGVIGEMIE
jgi:dihydroxyacetone kinase-like predicted kinase